MKPEEAAKVSFFFLKQVLVKRVLWKNIFVKKDGMQGMIKSWNKWAPSKNWTECCLNRLTLINEVLFFESALKIMTVTIQAKHWNLTEISFKSFLFYSISFSYLNLICLTKSRSLRRNCNTGWFSNKLSFLTFPPSLSCNFSTLSLVCKTFVRG